MTSSNRTGSNIRFFRAQTRLSQLAGRPGGLSRDEAVARATQRLEDVRDEYTCSLVALIADLPGLWAPSNRSMNESLDALEAAADRIINLAGSFGFASLSEAAMCLCDLSRTHKERHHIPESAITVAIDAVRLLAPSSEPLDQSAQMHLLNELQVLTRRLGAARSGR